MTEFDEYLFHAGTQYEAYRHFGAKICTENGETGTRFTVWAENAKAVSVVLGNSRPYETDGAGNFIPWNTPDAGVILPRVCPMEKTGNGIWSLFLPDIVAGTVYRYAVTGADGIFRYKTDPFGYSAEQRPYHGSVVVPPDTHEWHDTDFRQKLAETDPTAAPMAIYEVHLGSWHRKADGFMTYRELAEPLAEYVQYMGFTHVELMGICEYPFDGSWGYQVTGYYAPTSRYGSPEDFRFLVDTLHQKGIAVILDWVPAHFPKDAFGLEKFDGTAMYEYADPLRAEYPEWGTLAFDHGKPEVQSFLISNACYWLNEMHADALRVDAVAAMLYVSFSRKEWRPNKNGGTENLESFAFLRKLNEAVRTGTHGFLIAEDSSIEKGVTAPVAQNGLGFGFKWSMGWMNDTLRYIGTDPVFRSSLHSLLTYCSEYAFLENFVLVLSHDEVVHLKKSMVEKFPGNMMDKLGGLKTLYTYMFTFPGKKLLFMGQEFAMHREWDEEREIDWYLMQEAGNKDVSDCLRDLLRIYQSTPCLYTDKPPKSLTESNSFEWVRNNDSDGNTLIYLRRNPWNYDGAVLVLCNFSPMAHSNYRFGVPKAGRWQRIFSTYDHLTDGGHAEPLFTDPQQADGYAQSVTYSVRPYESILLTQIDG